MSGDEISDHVHYERGYDKGFEEGRKRAFELIGELAEFYENGVGIDEDASDEERFLLTDHLELKDRKI